MKLRSFFVALCFLPALVAQAPDAAMVLRTSVTYRTQRNSLTLTDSQKQEADRLLSEAQEANTAGRYSEAMRAMSHGLAVMRGTEWGPAVELTAALRPKLDHSMLEAGRHVTLTVTTIFAPQLPPEMQKWSGTVALVSGGKETSVAGGLTIAAGSLPQPVALTVPEIAPGNYQLELRLTGGDGANAGARVPVHVEKLADAVETLRARLAKAPRKDASTLATASYAVELYDRADAGDLNPTRVKFAEEIAAANGMLDALAAGRDPFAGKRGDLHKAYRSAVDNTLQPYRLFLPAAYDAAKEWPLVVALHGMGGDENTMFDGYTGSVKQAAERLGLVVVCPKGRDTASMYRGAAEQDVMDVLAEVRRDYKIDARRIYLMGHSMGGYGTWSTAMDHPEVFAALGPISGGGNPAGMEKIKALPQYVVHGDADPTVPVSQSRTMVAAGKKAGAAITYVEIPGGNHIDVAAPQVGPMFEFFVKQKRATEPRP
jgi:predicted esterase